jgi:hypothetical protein
MKKIVPLAPLALAILVAVLFAASHNSSVYASSAKLATVYEHDTTTKFFGNSQHKLGGYEVFTNPVYDANDKNVIGSSDGECTYASDTVYQCDWTLMLPHGNVVLSGAQTAQQSQTVYAVVGGTGAYYQIKGEAILDFIHTTTGNEYKYTFHLS